MTCKNCGANIAEGMLFCGECGTFQTVVKPNFCGKCGGTIADGDSETCADCHAKEGVPVAIPEPVPTPEPAPTSEVAPTPEPVPPTPAPEPVFPPESVPELENKSGKTPMIIAAILMAVILCEVAYYCLVPMGGMDKIKQMMSGAASNEASSAIQINA